MPRANAVYVDRLRECVIAALRDFNLPAMIPTREILSQTQPKWESEPMCEFVSLNEVVIGRMMGRLGYAQVHGPMFNGWWVEHA